MSPRVTSTLYGRCPACRVIRWAGIGQPADKHICAVVKLAWRVLVERRKGGR